MNGKIKYRQWEVPSFPTKAYQDLCAAGIPSLLAAILSVRGIQNAENALPFFPGQLQELYDPFLLKDMDRAVVRIHRALQRRETICVYGDYDVDGVTSTCILTDYLQKQGGHIIPYIPNRLEEGYGLNLQAIEALHNRGVSLIITVDCGITAINEVEQARTFGVDIIVTDHHQCQDRLPSSVAVVDPHRQDCDYPFPNLAGVGVTLKLVTALCPSDQQDAVVEEYIDLVAMGTIADVMDLTDENRTLVLSGLAALEQTRRPGLRALLEHAGVWRKPVTATTISYSLAPRINAAGRMGSSMTALHLLLSEDPAQAEELSSQLEQLNRDRQKIEGNIFQECISFIDSQGNNFPVLVLASENWHPGVVGIVASRLAEQYRCPVFIICLTGNIGKGSCRSYGNFNLFSALQACSSLLQNFGGHEQAAGFTIDKKNIDEFRHRMEQIVSQFEVSREGIPFGNVLHADLLLNNASWLTLEQVESLRYLEPCGPGNPSPILVLKNTEVISVNAVGNGGRHLKLCLQHYCVTLDAIFFSSGALINDLHPGDRIHVAVTPQINEYHGKRSVQLLLYDLEKTTSAVAFQYDLLSRLSDGGPFSKEEADIITPCRLEFELVWRYLVSRANLNQLEDSPNRLSLALSKGHTPEQAFGRTMVCIYVFQEQGLIQLEKSAQNCICIHFLPIKGKVDLEQSSLLRGLRHLSEE